MNDPAAARTVFADTVDIVQWLQQDSETPYPERLRRDREIGASLQSGDTLWQVREWWHRLRERVHVDPGTGSAQIERTRRVIALIMLIAGFSFGVATAGAVLHYDGTWPVNVVTALATLVLIQAVLITLSMFLMLPRLPGIAAVQDLLQDINPSALIASIYRRLRRQPSDDRSLMDFQRVRGPAAARLVRWQILEWSQLAAMAFNVAAIATLAVLVAFTDLAFGWSTTLQLGSGEALRITDTISMPWRSFWPDAVPSAQLLEQSRFFRLADARPVIVSAAELAGWWPFLLAALLFYGLIPRCLLFIFARMRLRASTRRFLLDDPQVQALLDRMRSVHIEPGIADTEENAARDDQRPEAGAAPTATSPAIAIVWSTSLETEAVKGWVSKHLSWRIADVVTAGGAASLADDAASIESAVEAKAPAMIVLVRAWEAPLLDLRDFLVELRTRAMRGSTIIVAPVGYDGTAATAAQRTTWSRWAASIGDPALYVETGT